MRIYPEEFSSNPLFLRIKSWTKLLSVTGGAQIMVQALGFVSGLIVIRYLSTQEYAFYTLANSFLGTMTVIANGGVSTGVMAEGGKVWKDPKQLGAVLATGFELRKIFSIISLIIGIPILIYLLIKNKASYVTSICIVLALIPAFFATLSNALLVIAPKLHQDIIPLQKNYVGVNLARLILLGLSVFMFPLAYVAISSASVAQILGNIRLRKIAAKQVDLKQKPSPLVRKNILKTVKRILPDAIYYSLSGQITIWLLSLFGSTTSLAEIGALGRIAMLLTVISMLFGTLIVPRFSRALSNFKRLIHMYLISHFLLIVILVIVVCVVSFFSKEILWILGEKYQNLNYEIVLAIIGSSLYLFAGVIYNLSSSRGWILHPFLYISLNIITLIFAIILLDISTLKGVLLLNIIVGGVQLIIHSLYGFYRIFKLKV